MKLKQFYICTVLILLAALPLDVFAQGGESSYQFLNITPSSRVYALGGQNISLVNEDITLVNQNPALLGKEMSLQLGLNYMHYLGGSNFMGATFGIKAHERGAIAVGLQYFGYGEMTGTDANGIVTGSFSPNDIAFNVMYTHDITDRLRGGINLRVISSNYEQYSAVAMTTDIGLNYFNPDNNLSLSLVAKNLGGQLKKFNDANQNASMPWDIQLGWSQFLKNLPIRLSITAFNLTRWKMPYYDKEDASSNSGNVVRKSNFASNLFRHLVFGVEYSPSEKFYIALGYNYKTRSDMTTFSRNFLSGFSLGAGVNVKMIGIDAAIAQPHIGGLTLMFNLRCRISDFLN